MTDMQPIEPSDETPTVDPGPVFVPASQIPRPATPPQTRPGYREPKPVLIPQLDQKARLPVGRLMLARGRRNEWYADIPEGVSVEAMLRPAFWLHHARQVAPLDKIEAFAEDASWEGLFRVMAKTNTELRLSPIYYVEHGAEQVGEPSADTYAVQWRGPAAKFCVVVVATGEIVRKGIPTKDEAHSALGDHMRRMRR